jgi:hypothetical protein
MYQLRKIGFPLIFLLFLVCSCNKDETSYLADLCVVKERGDHTLYLLSDNDIILNPSSSLDSTKYGNGQRFRVTYIKMEGKTSSSKNEELVEIRYMLPVLIRSAVAREDLTNKLDSPIWLLCKPWFGGGYLNFNFSFSYKDSKIEHGIYLVRDSLVHETSGDKNKIYMTFGHDANGDATSITTTALASFPVTSISGIESADSLIINVLESTKYDKYRISVSK